MDQEIKRRWVEALRSGKYKKGYGVLKTPDGRYCCLGVLCEVLGPSEDIHIFNDRIETVTRSPGTKNTPTCAKYHKVLGPDLREKVGIRKADEKHLTELNDSGNPFGFIARFIEMYM